MKSHNYSYEVNEICWNKSSDLFLLTTGNGTIEMLQYPSMESVHSLKVRQHYNLACGCLLSLKWTNGCPDSTLYSHLFTFDPG